MSVIAANPTLTSEHTADWVEVPLEELAVPGGLVRGPFGGALTKASFVRRGYKVYEQRNAIYRSSEIGRYYVDHAKYNELARFQVSPGDLIVSCSGTIGQIFEIPEGAPEGVINQALLKIRLNPTKVDRGYFLHVFRSEDFQERIKENTHGGAMQNLVGMPIFRRTALACPQSVAEQKAIGEALSDADTLMASLERLIVKKRDIKHAAMQQLLTGNTRLSGFTGRWSSKAFSELFDFYGGVSASRAQLTSDVGFCYLHYGDIHSLTNPYVDADKDFAKIPKLPIDIKRVSPGSILQSGDVVFVDASEDDEGTSRHVVIRNDSGRPFIAGLHTIVAKRKSDELDPRYLCYCLQTAEIHDQFKFYAVGTKVKGVNKTTIKNIRLTFPDVDEQIQIARVLSEMDSELYLLTMRLGKTREIKQGMMQQLLTGKVRLV